MDRNDLLNQHKKVLSCLSNLPKQIINSEHLENIPEFVLHDLCHNCFNLNKAAYFVDNPDFNCVKGIAGFCESEGYSDHDNIWQHPETFSLFMQSSLFNKKVKNFESHSSKRSNNSYDELVRQIANTVGIENPAYCLWDMKHYNHGLVVYEKTPLPEEDLFKEHFSNSLHLLSFCPIH